MNRSPLSDFNRRRSLFDSPNLVRFLSKTLHKNDKLQSELDSSTSSNSPIQPRFAVTRKLSNMNEQQSPLQLNRGISQLSLVTSENHLTVKSKKHLQRFDKFNCIFCFYSCSS